MANTTKLFFTTTDPQNYLANLKPEQTNLIAAKRKVRDHLRATFASRSMEFFGRSIAPRFFTQGSVSYKTLNNPAWPPVQQKDLDDGCYLPLSFVKGQKPSLAAKMFFEFVDEALKELAELEGWRHETKPTCVRLVVGHDEHIDVPLYAIPDEEFLTLDGRDIAMAANAKVRVKKETWEELPSNTVLLAHREEDWIDSDPRKISDWFLDRVDLFGEILRRDARYLKAWRDYVRLDTYRLTSILLMVCIWQAYEEIGGLNLASREDERLLQVLEKLPKYINGPVWNPGNTDEDINRIPKEHRPLVTAKIEALTKEIRFVVKDCKDAQEAVDRLQSCFGKRIPWRPDLVSIPAAAIAAVLATPKKATAAPEVGRSTSG